MSNVNMIQLEKEMNKAFIGRKNEIHSLLISLLVRGNIVLLGDPGTGKTAMVKTLAKQINGKCFSTLLNKTSTAEELFGAYDINELEKGIYKRNTENTMVDSDVAFIDECFKCNSEVLNSMLGVMADREFRNGQALPEQIDTQLVVGASNEMPDGGAEGELAAFWDRFEMRHVVENIKTEDDFKKLLIDKERPLPTTKVEMYEIKEAYDEFKEYNFEKIIPNLIEIKAELLMKKIKVSDRRWHNCLKYLQASAWLDGRTEVNHEDIKILKHMFWNEPEQIKIVEEVVDKFAVDRTAERFKETLELSTDIIATIETAMEDIADGCMITTEEYEEISNKVEKTLENIRTLKNLGISKEQVKLLMENKAEIAKKLKELQECEG